MATNCKPLLLTYLPVVFWSLPIACQQVYTCPIMRAGACMPLPTVYTWTATPLYSLATYFAVLT